MAEHRTLCLADDSVRRVRVYPSMVIFDCQDGTEITLDVGALYACLAAHLAQNGIWNDLDFAALVPAYRERFDFGGMQFGQYAVTGLRFRRGPLRED